MQLECMEGNDTINFYKKYDGIVESQIDFPIKNVGIVKADIVLFEDLEFAPELDTILGIFCNPPLDPLCYMPLR